MKTMKKRGAFLLAAVLLCLCFCGCGKQASASTTVPSYEYVFREIGEQELIKPAEKFAGGSGTEKDPYQISNAAELALLGEVYEILAQTFDSSDERVAPYYKAHFVLTEDIVLNERAEGEDWSKTAPKYAWRPIGLHRGFEGVFDGAGHTVSGLYINTNVQKEDVPSGNCFGLFGQNGGTIKNVNLDKAYICVSGCISYVGGIAGDSRLKDYSIDNCSVNAEICFYDGYCGGITGESGGTVKNCSFSGSVTCLREDSAGGEIGGIVGYNSGTVEGCTNSAPITDASARSNVGGIVGAHHGGEIRNCENTGDVTGGEDTGGIAGNVFLTSGGGELKATQADIVNSKNSGDISASGINAGGIAGGCTLSYSDCGIKISGCENTGHVQAPEKIGGVIGLVTLQGKDGAGVTVSGCTNTADLSGYDVGGITGSVSGMFGALTLTGCKNSGEIKAEFYGAGITAENNLMIWQEEKAYPLNITVAGCENTGAVTTRRGGGIAGVFTSTYSVESGERVTVTLENNVQNADIFCTSDNSFVGGIAGNVGVPNGTVTVKNCRSSGAITFPEVKPDKETTGIPANGLRLELSRNAGGIVGMVDSGLFLSNDNDGKDATQVNKADAKIVFTGCHSDMTFVAPAESEYVYDDDGTPVIRNCFGGVVGFNTDDEGMAFRVEDCTYTGCDRGLGNDRLPDVGTKR